MGIQIIGNIDAQAQIQGRANGLQDLRPITGFPQLVAGDSRVVDLFLTSTAGALNIQDYPTVRLGMGGLNDRPTAGTYEFESSAALQYNHTAAELKTQIDAQVATVTVELLSPFTFLVDFDAVGAQTLPTVDATNLSPESTVSVKRLVTGTASIKERWIWRLYRNPIALATDFTNIAGDGIRGALNLGTKGIYRLFSGGAISATTTIELELTDADGDIQTIFQLPVTVRGEVLGEGIPAVVDLDALITITQYISGLTKNNTVWVAKNGSDSNGARNRFDLPFLTVTAAQAAAVSGDTIIALPGDYSAETELAGKDGVFYWFTDGAIGPAFEVTTAITVKGRGLCQSLTCDNAGAVMDMPDMNTVASIVCENGTQTAGNAGIYIQCFDGTQTAGNAGTFIECIGGTQTAGNAGTTIDCQGGTQTAGNAGTTIYCDIGTQTAGNAGTTITCTSGTQTAGNGRNVLVSGAGNCTILGNIIDTRTDQNAVSIANNFSGTLRIKGGIKNVTGTSKGINYGTSVTGTVILDNCTIETTGASIDAPAAQTVIAQGLLNVTQDVDADITIDPAASKVVNAAFKVF